MKLPKPRYLDRSALLRSGQELQTRHVRGHLHQAYYPQLLPSGLAQGSRRSTRCSCLDGPRCDATTFLSSSILTYEACMRALSPENQEGRREL